jgi:hypothetical protein
VTYFFAEEFDLLFGVFNGGHRQKIISAPKSVTHYGAGLTVANIS